MDCVGMFGHFFHLEHLMECFLNPLELSNVFILERAGRKPWES